MCFFAFRDRYRMLFHSFLWFFPFKERTKKRALFLISYTAVRPLNSNLYTCCVAALKLINFGAACEGGADNGSELGVLWDGEVHIEHSVKNLENLFCLRNRC